MTLSVVVPTFRRPKALAKCLDALEGQELRVAEILVVVRTDDDQSSSALAGREGPIRVIPVEVPPGRPGFVAGLNAGLDASTGEIVGFTDDDAEPRPDWSSRIVAGFAVDPRLGALGGRDLVFIDGVLLDGVESVVGMVDRLGRTVGNHHLGAGPAREVDVLKGVNLSVRGDLARSIRFDTRLLGIATEHHSELHFCQAVRRRGFRVVYDPELVVDHRPSPRTTGESRDYGPRQLHYSSHNETLAVLESLPASRRVSHVLFSTLVGSHLAPGLAQSARRAFVEGSPRLDLLRANLAGRRRAFATRRRSRVLAVADSANGALRARQLLAGRPGARVLAPVGARGALQALAAVAATRARSLYLVDVGKVTALAAVLGRVRRRRIVLDTGDAAFSLARSLGDRSFPSLLLVGVGEKISERSADVVVIRGRLHADLIPGPTVHVPDLAPPGAAPVDATALRRELGLDGGYVVGLVGSLILSKRLGVSYGWDLVEALAKTEPQVQALIVGDGSGREGLERRARELGVADRCRFVGLVPAERVSAYVCAMDVTISTQTNDRVGRVRTTGKLPLYLTCERPVLASDVGEAARLLGPHGWTVPFRGQLDPDYPTRLAARIETWRADPDGEGERRRLAARIAAAEFDPAILRARLRPLLDPERTTR